MHCWANARKVVLRTKTIAHILSVLFLVFATQDAFGRTLCGESYGGVGALKEAIMVRPNVKSFDQDSQIASLFEPDRRTLWWFAKPGTAAYPMVACLREIDRNGSYVRLPVQRDCAGAPTKACDAVAKRLERVVF